MRITVRPATAADASFIAEMANALNDLEGKPGHPFDEARVLEDGFGPDLAFRCWIAELNGARIGYAMASDCYDTDRATRGLWLNDLYVVESARGRGAGHALFAAVAAEALRLRRGLLAWGVTDGNDTALAFYLRRGATSPRARIYELDGAALRALAQDAAESPEGPA